MEAKSLRGIVDELKNSCGEVVILLANVVEDKISLIAGVTPSLTAKLERSANFW